MAYKKWIRSKRDATQFFPFADMDRPPGGKIDWDGVYEAWSEFVRYAKKHNIKMKEEFDVEKEEA